MSRPAGCTPSIRCGTASTPIDRWWFSMPRPSNASSSVSAKNTGASVPTSSRLSMILLSVNGPVIRSRVPDTPSTRYGCATPMPGVEKAVVIRVIYYLVDREDVLLVTVYSKTEQADIETDQIQKIIKEEHS